MLEVGAGTGLNLPFYGADVERLTLTEPDPSMFKRLERAAAHYPGAAMVLRAPAEQLSLRGAISSEEEHHRRWENIANRAPGEWLTLRCAAEWWMSKV